MKVFRIIGFSLLATSLLCACSDNQEEDIVNSNEKIVSFTASDFEYDALTRTAFNITSNGAEFTWAEKDTIGIFPDEGDQVSFSMEKGAGSNYATFDGGAWNLKGSHTYYAYFPFNRKNFGSQEAKKAIPVSYEGQKQIGNNNPDNIGLYDYMTAIGTTPENGALNFQFNHLGALLQINATMPKAMSIKTVSLNVDSDILISKGSYDLTAETPTITSATKSKSLKLGVEELTLSDNDLNLVAYMMIPPCNLLNKTITIIIETEDGEKYYGEFTGKNYEAGKAYQLDVTNLSISNETFVATLETAGTLASVLGSQMLTLSSLKVIGEINGTDIKCLRQMLGALEYDEADSGNLTALNLSEATIVAGGDAYFQTYKTANNKVGQQMFMNCPNLQSIRIPENTTKIESKAFYGCGELSSINIPSKTSYIDYETFDGCGKLTDVYITDLMAWCNISGLKAGLKNGFAHLNLYLNGELITNLEIPEGVTTIRYYAFYGCSSLTSVTIPSSVTTIESGVFEECSSLTSVTIPNSVATIGRSAFSSCI